MCGTCSGCYSRGWAAYSYSGCTRPTNSHFYAGADQYPCPHSVGHAYASADTSTKLSTGFDTVADRHANPCANSDPHPFGGVYP